MHSSTFKPLFRRLLRPATAFATIAALTAAAACSDSTAPNTQLSGGTYQLSTVNGSTVPYTYGSGSSNVTIQSDVYTLNTNGSYSETINETLSNGSQNSQATDAESGTWYQNGSAVVFNPTYSTQNNYTQYTGALAGGSTFSHSTLTFSYNGVVWVYSHT